MVLVSLFRTKVILIQMACMYVIIMNLAGLSWSCMTRFVFEHRELSGMQNIQWGGLVQAV